MASTWLLAVFGGIGFVLANKIGPWLLYTAMIGFLGSIRIMLLWIIDLRVYQQLLNAAFSEGLKLENEYKWLPRIRNNMIDTIETGSVSVNISWFYVLDVCGTLLIFNFSISAYLLLKVSLVSSILAIVVSGVMVFYLAYRIRFKSREQSIRELKVEAVEKVRRSDRRMLLWVGCRFIWWCMRLYA